MRARALFICLVGLLFFLPANVLAVTSVSGPRINNPNFNGWRDHNFKRQFYEQHPSERPGAVHSAGTATHCYCE